MGRSTTSAQQHTAFYDYRTHWSILDSLCANTNTTIASSIPFEDKQKTMEPQRKTRRPWETDTAKESVAQILGALAFGKKTHHEDATMSSTHDDEESMREGEEVYETVMSNGTAAPAEEAQMKESTAKHAVVQQEDGEQVESNHELIDHTSAADDDSDVNSIEENEAASALLENPKPPVSPKHPASTTATAVSPVREIVREYESSRDLAPGISPRVEELLRMIPDGHVKEKIDTVEVTHQMMLFKRVAQDCANTALRRIERPMTISLAAAEEMAEQETLKKQRLQAEMEEGRRRAMQAMRRSSNEGLVLPEFDEDDDDDVKSLDSLDGNKPVLSVSLDDAEHDELVEEIIGEDEMEEVVIEEHEDSIVEETVVDDVEETIMPQSLDESPLPVKHEDTEESPHSKHPEDPQSVDHEELLRQKKKEELEDWRRRAAAALKKDPEDGTIETAASTTKTTQPDLVLLESKSEDSEKPSPRCIPAEITEPPTRTFDQFSDVLSSAVSSVNEADSLQQTSPRKRVAEIIRRDLWDKDVTVVEAALQLLVDKLMHSTDVITFRNAIARNGGILAIVRAMEQHVEHAGVQIASCRALEQLALETENELAIGEVGGVEAILGAMMTHFTQVDVQDAAWSALCNCTCGNACDVMTIDTQGGMTAIVSCMKQHMDNASIQSSAVGTLTNLCWNNPGRMEELVKAGGFVAMAKTLQTHWDNEIVRNETAHAMHVLLGGAALAHQTLQGEPDVIDELVLAECDTDEELEDGDYTEEEVP